MSMMSERLSYARTWFDERPIRERVLISITVLVLIVLAGWELWVAPAVAQVEHYRVELADLEQTRADLLAQETGLQQQLREDPSAELRERIAGRERRLARIDQQITETTGRLIPPRAMVVMLQEMLATEDRLELKGVQLLAPEPVYADGSAAVPDDDREALLYAHEVDITVQGGYLEVLGYLERLEAMDERLSWVLLEYETGEWPAGTARVRVRTLSLEPVWLGV